MSYERLVELLRECAVDDETIITPETSLKEGLMLSSFTMMVLIVKVEKELGHEVDPVVLADSSTVKDLFIAINAL